MHVCPLQWVKLVLFVGTRLGLLNDLRPQMCFTAGLMLQAFAVASHACHVHLGSKPGPGQAPAALPCLRSAQTPALPSNNSVPLPQLEVRHGWTHISALGLLCWLCLTLFVHVSSMHLAWCLSLCHGSWQSTEACIHVYTSKLKPCTSAPQRLVLSIAVQIVPAYHSCCAVHGRGWICPRA